MKAFQYVIRGIALTTCLSAAGAAMAQTVTQVDDADNLPSAARAYLEGLGFRFAGADVISGGDMSGDSIDDTVVQLWYFNQNSVDLNTLVLQGKSSGPGMEYVGRVYGAGGVQPSDIQFGDGVVTFKVLTVGPDDQRCCPTQETMVRISMDDIE